MVSQMNFISIIKNKHSANVIGIGMFILYAFAVLVLMRFKDYWVSEVQVFHVSCELLCMAVTLVMYRLHLGKKRENDKKEICFTGLCIAAYIALFLDAVSWIVDGSVELIVLNRILKDVVFILIFVLGAIYFEYVYSYVENMSADLKTLKTRLYMLLSPVFVIRMIMIFTGQYFTISPDGHYETGEFYLLSFLFIPLLVLFTCGITAGNGVSTRRMVSFMSYPIATISMMGIAYINVNYTNSLVAITLALIYIYCATFIDMEQKKTNLDESLHTYLADGASVEKTNLQDGKSGRIASATILFGSLHRFGEAMETMEPEDAVIVLNHFYSAMTEVVEKNHGRLLEYPGYGIYCIFMESDDLSNHALNAVNAAIGMLKKMKEINIWTLTNHYPKLSLGIGINTGTVVIGNIGSQNHLRYSAIGRSVNLASRTEIFSKDDGIMITQSTLDQCAGNIKATLVDRIVPKGMSAPVSLYKIDEANR